MIFRIFLVLAISGSALGASDCQDVEKDLGKGYNGNETKTKNGNTCQAWSSQEPHKHKNTEIGDNNFCRNPDGEDGVWCYTTDPKTRWEYCDVALCSVYEDNQEHLDLETNNTSSLQGDTNGELVCEGHGYDIDECYAKDCCHWYAGECWSTVGAGSCLSAGGQDVCEGKGLSQTQCLSKGCCHWLQGKCWSSVGSESCESGNVPEWDEAEFEECLMNAPGSKLVEYATMIQCEVLKEQSRLILNALALTGCPVDLDVTSSYNSSMMKCDEAVIEALVPLTQEMFEQETELQHIKLIEKVRGLEECGNKNGTWQKKQVCDSVTRVYHDLANDVFRMCIAPYPEERAYVPGCSWWKTIRSSAKVVAAAAGCSSLLVAGRGVESVVCIAKAAGVATDVVQCTCKMLGYTFCM